MRTRVFRRSLLVAGSLILAGPARASQPALLFHAQGEMAGEPGADSVLLQSRLTAAEALNEARGITGAPGVARFVVDRGTEDTTITTPWLGAESVNDYIVRQ